MTSAASVRMAERPASGSYVWSVNVLVESASAAGARARTHATRPPVQRPDNE